MKSIALIPEAEMVVAFLQAEIKSPRMQHRIIPVLQRDGIDPRIIDHPDLSDPHENAYRARVLGESRGYKRNFRLFKHFPDHIHWERVCLDQDDLQRAKYINYPYWVHLSHGSRKVIEAAEYVRKGVEVDGQSNRVFWNIANVIMHGIRLPEVIFVSATRGTDLILLEGSHRTTSYLLVSEYMSGQLHAIVGFSPNILDWFFY
jgi:hypothetical protein